MSLYDFYENMNSTIFEVGILAALCTTRFPGVPTGKRKQNEADTPAVTQYSSGCALIF